MDLIASEYDDDAVEPVAAPVSLLSSKITSAPGAAHHAASDSTSIIIPSKQSSALTMYNSDSAKADIMWAPAFGPSNVGGVKKIPTPGTGTIAGAVNQEVFDPTIFERQYRQFSSFGYTSDPRGTGAMIGDVTKFLAHAGSKRPLASLSEDSNNNSANNTATDDAVRVGGGRAEVVGAIKRARVDAGAVDDVDSWKGPWAGYAGEDETKKSALQLGQLTDFQKKVRAAQGYNPDRPGKVGQDTGAAPIVAAEPVGAAGAGEESEIATTESENSKKKPTKPTVVEKPARTFDWGEEVAPANTGATIKPEDVESTFHGKEEFDYQGRSWMEPPKGVRPDGGEHECFLPKKCIHKYTGHTKGVQSIQLFPGTGHLLLSGSLDSKVKIWDVGRDWNAKRTYVGHTAAVREVRFDNDGRSFSTASYDRHVKVWDTETGTCKMDITNGKVPYCVTWYPEDNNIILVGMANRKIMQYDVRSGEMVLEYDYHLGPVNSITFFDGNRRIASTSDDKKVLFWDFNTPVPIKTIQDPMMHAITSVAMHPTEESFAGQSMDNHVVVYHAGERTGLNRKKRFGGHVVAGYACQVNFSPSGQYLTSGDGDGNVWFWDWKTTKLLKKMKCHDGGPAIGVAWHPLQPSWVFTCGWDGLIKAWD